MPDPDMDADRHLPAAFEHAPVPLLLTTRHGAVLRANAAARQALGLEEDELRGGFPLDGDVSVARFDGGDGDQLAVVALRPGAGVDALDPYRDALTGLPNRMLFDEHLGLAVARADREHSAVAVVHVDLDGFAELDETHGSDVADEVLRRAADRLQASGRLSDVVARDGGDEFLVLVGDLARRVCLPAAEGIALRIEDALSAPFVLDGETVECSASAGFAVYPKPVREAGGLVQAAREVTDARKRARRDAAA